MFTLLIALGLMVVMVVLGLGSSVLWMRPAKSDVEETLSAGSVEPGSMILGENDEARAA